MIKKIVIEIGGKEVELTIDEMMKLRSELNGILSFIRPEIPVYPQIYKNIEEKSEKSIYEKGFTR